MNITIFKVVARFLSFVILSTSSLLHSVNLDTRIIGVNNGDKNMTSSANTAVVSYDTIVKYNSKIPSGITKVKSNGEDGLVSLDINGNVFSVIKEKKDEIIEVGTGKVGTYTGLLTGYGPDCDTCDGAGWVYCPSPDGTFFNLNTDGEYFYDSEYGAVRIVAAAIEDYYPSPGIFPCGTIIEINNPPMGEPFLAVVLDTGYDMRKHYNEGYIHLDLAHTTQVGLRFHTNKQAKFQVQRWGW